MTELGQTLSTTDLQSLIADILDCIEGPNGSLPDVIRIEDNIIILKIDGFHFKIHIQDQRQLQ